MASGGCSGDDVAPAKEAAARPDVPNPWRRVTPAASDTDDSCLPLMGGAELWPTLSAAAAAAKAKTPASSAAAVVADPPKPTGSQPITRGNPGASSSRHGDRAAPVPARRAATPEPPPIHPNRSGRAHAPEPSSPGHALNHRTSNNNAGVRGHQNWRSPAPPPPHPHGRGTGGYTRAAASRRPQGSSANERGNNADVVHLAQISGNGGRGGWRGQEPRGGFDGWRGQEHRAGFSGQQRPGRTHHHQHGHHGPVQHRPQGPRMEPPPRPHPMHPPIQMPPPLPPFMGMLDPLTPHYGPPIGYYPPYGYPEYAPVGHYFAPLPEQLPPFVPYPALPMHMMHPHLEQQAPAAAPYVQHQQQAAALTPDEVERILRAQIEFYFSPNNLCTDTYLRARMDEQGWVPLTVIAEFPRIKEKTNDMDLILKAVLPSTEVEVQDGKLRRRVGWKIYPLPGIN
ncbi:hypothetical protein ACP4OV_027814 [Aristida adscensionis]